MLSLLKLCHWLPWKRKLSLVAIRNINSFVKLHMVNNSCINAYWSCEMKGMFESADDL